MVTQLEFVVLGVSFDLIFIVYRLATKLKHITEEYEAREAVSNIHTPEL